MRSAQTLPFAATLLLLALSGCVVVEAPQATPTQAFPTFPELVEDTPRLPPPNPDAVERPQHQGVRVCTTAAWEEPGLFARLQVAGPEAGVSGPTMPLVPTFGLPMPGVAAMHNVTNALRQVTMAQGNVTFAVSPEAGIARMPMGTTQDEGRAHFEAWASAVTTMDAKATDEAWRRFWPTQVEAGGGLSLRIPSVKMDPAGLWEDLQAQGHSPVLVGKAGPEVSYALGAWRFDVVLAQRTGFWSTFDGNVTLAVPPTDQAHVRIEGIGMTLHEARLAWSQATHVVKAGLQDHQPDFAWPQPC